MCGERAGRSPTIALWMMPKAAAGSSDPRWPSSCGSLCAGRRLRRAGRVRIALTSLSAAEERIAAAVIEDLAPAEVVTDHERQAGLRYWRDLCFKINASADGEVLEIGDGGFTDWTTALAKIVLGNLKKEL